MKLYDHQKNFIKENPSKALVCFGAGTGKTITAIKWLTERKNIIIICPKTIKQKWIDELLENGILADVYTKEEFKKIDLTTYDTMVFDEVQFANSPLFTKQRSQISTKVYEWMRSKKDYDFLGLTATPISSNPWNCHTLLTFAGHYIDWKKFRGKFFTLESPRFMKGRMAWMPKEKWREEARILLEKYAHTATMEDIVEYIPEQHHKVVNITIPKETLEEIKWQSKNPELESDPAIWHARRKLEQVPAKITKIKELSMGHSKVVIFVYYKEQIKVIEKQLSKERKTYVMTGDTKDQGAVIKEAQKDTECYFIVQTDVSAGYEIPEFTCLIFASQSFKKISETQAIARVQRINNLKSNWYYYLVAGPKDKAVRERLDAGEDFIIKNR